MKIKFIVGLIFFTIFGYSQNWESNFEEAKARATKENKNIILVFSGSDWCAPCMKLDKVVWQSDIFKFDSEKNWVIYKADFPKKKANQLTDEKIKENKQLAEKYNLQGSFPLLVILDKNAKVIAMTGYKNITAEEYVKLIHSFEKQ